MNRRILPALAGAAGMLLLILDGRTALSGAREGVQLCMQTVVPSLFPFFVLSGLVLGNGLSGDLLRTPGRWFHIPPGSEGLLFTGLLGGYPVGAQGVADAFRAGKLNRSQAQRMVCLCNAPGPAFLFGILGSKFPHPVFGWLLWGTVLLGAVAAAQVLPQTEMGPVTANADTAPSLPQCVRRAVSAIAMVCGWVILFRVLLAFLDRWVLWLFPAEVKVLICGTLELTNGCCALDRIENIGLRFLLAAAMLSFGGLCVTMQTFSAMGTLDRGQYFQGKLIQGLCSAVAAYLIQLTFPQNYRIGIRGPFIVCLVGMAVIFLCSTRKSSSNSREVRV